jgi:hypothetical protein
MADLSNDWELVSRRARGGSPGVLSALRSMLVRDPAKTPQPFTWTLRHRTTGRIRRLTARTELEATVKIANGLFDSTWDAYS